MSAAYVQPRYTSSDVSKNRLFSSPFLMEWALFCVTLAIAVLGIALRFYELGNLPYGIYHDEAFYGLDAVSILNGNHPIFFTANNGREPLYIYLLSLSIAAFGRTPFGLRFASAVIGTLTIPVTYLLGRALFNHRVGLLAMAICAVTFWPLALSRVSFRAGALPLFIGLAIALGWLAWQKKNIWFAILGGIAYGLTFNTYTASRVTPLALVLFAGLLYFFHRREHKEKSINNSAVSVNSARSAVKLGLAFAVATALVVAPLGFYALAHPDQVFTREGQVSIFSIEGGNPVVSLLKHTGLALGMFGFYGDSIARHNLPGRPVFDLWTFVFFLIGLVILVIQLRWTETRPAPLFILTWLAVTILPTILAEDTPHYLRSIAMLPVLWLVPAIGFETVLHRWPRVWAYAAIFLSLIASTLLTTYDYYIRYVPLPITHYYFEAAATELAAEINNRPAFSNVRMDNRLWDNFASLRFLKADDPPGDAPDHVQLVVWPYEPDAVKGQVLALPTGSVISAHRGPLAQGDLETTPYSLYTLYWAEPASAEPVTASFGLGEVQLRRTEVIETGDSFHIRLGWSVSSPVSVDYHVFVHVLVGGEIAAQKDGEPLDGLYHFSWLKPGDILSDEYILPKGEQVRVGVYAPDGTPLGEPVFVK